MGDFEMKAFALIAALFVSASAHAVVQPEGTFTPSRCGSPDSQEQNILPELNRACLGTVVGQPGKDVVSLRMQDGSDHQLEVVRKENLLIAFMSGATKSILHLENEQGETASMKVIVGKDGLVQSAMVSFKGVEYFVPKFEAVFTVQSGLSIQ